MRLDTSAYIICTNSAAILSLSLFHAQRTFLFIIPKRAALASRAAYVSHRPEDTCWTKHIDSPYFISGKPIPSTSRFWATSTFSCSGEPRGNKGWEGEGFRWEVNEERDDTTAMVPTWVERKWVLQCSKKSPDAPLYLDLHEGSVDIRTQC